MRKEYFAPTLEQQTLILKTSICSGVKELTPPGGFPKDAPGRKLYV